MEEIDFLKERKENYRKGNFKISKIINEIIRKERRYSEE
jgi:hypothetical protein